MINYLCTSPAEILADTDAIYQEIALLNSAYPGPVTSLFPLRKPSSLVPPPIMGLHNCRSIRKQEKNHQINHVFAAGLFHLPLLYFLKKPIVYTVVGGISRTANVPPRSFIRRLDRLVVSSERDKTILEDKLEAEVKCILPSIQVENFTQSPRSLTEGETLHLLMASAPWEQAQFKSKGIHIILEALQSVDRVHVTFLWRGLHLQHMRELIEKYGVGERVQLIDQKVDINQLMQKVHGTILLCNDTAVIKSYPHSLIESLVSGRPLITTREIAMSDMVTEKECGFVLETFSAASLLRTLAKFREEYAFLQQNTMGIPKSLFAPSETLAKYGKIYEGLL